MDDTQARKKIRLVVGGMVVFILAIVVVALINILPKIGKVEVYIGYAPFVSEVKLNNEKIKNNSKIYLEEGEYLLSVEYEGFGSVEKMITITRETSAVYGSLIAETDEANVIANEHIDDYYKIDGYFGDDLVEEGKKEDETWPIITRLPISSSLYGVGYIMNDDGGMTLTVTSSATYMDVAVGKLMDAAKEINDNLAKYRIDFKEYLDVLAGSFVANDENFPETFVRKGFSGVGGFDIVADGRIGDYYFAYVVVGSEKTYSIMHYRLIAHWSDAGWNLVSTPVPVATMYNMQDAPMEVLEAVNAL